MKPLKQFPKKDYATNTRLYDEYIHEYYMDNGWLPGNQKYNFNALLKLPRLAGKSLKGASILDVGCGTGDFLPILKKKGISEYLGIDIYEPSLKKAQQKYQDATFICGDLLTLSLKQTFDYAFCSGALTVKLSVDNYDFLQAMIRRMWELTTVGLAFNVLTDDDEEPDPDLFFYNPEKVLEKCLEVAPEAVIGAEKTPTVAQIHVYMYRPEEKLDNSPKLV